MKIKLLALLVITLASCQSPNQSLNLKVADFSEKSSLANSKIIDVRTPEEFQKGFIKGAVNIDYNSSNFENEISKLDKNETYFLYCFSGHRSGDAMNKMQSLGFKNTYSLEGGIKAWKAENRPVENAGNNDTSQNSQLSEKNSTDFKTAIYGEKLVFVDFNAPWCGPCKKMQPFVDILKEERSEEVLVFSINTDEQTQLAQEYSVVNLPTIILIKKGAVLYRAEGYQDQQNLNDLVTKYK